MHLLLVSTTDQASRPNFDNIALDHVVGTDATRDSEVLRSSSLFLGLIVYTTETCLGVEKRWL